MVMEVKARLSQTDNIETWIQLRVGSGFVGDYNINTMTEKYLRLPRSVGLAFKIVTDDPDTWGVVQVELNSFENLHVINSYGRMCGTNYEMTETAPFAMGPEDQYLAYMLEKHIDSNINGIRNSLIGFKDEPESMPDSYGNW